MAVSNPLDNNDFKPKTFWQKPEGKTGALFLVGVAAVAGYFLFTAGAAVLTFLTTTIGIVISLLVLGAIIYMALDPKVRAVVGYMYKSIMRKITGIFVTIDPIGILKNYISDLEDNLQKMSKQIGSLRGQMRKIKDLISSNTDDIKQNLLIAKKAKEQGNSSALTLATRKAARLKESNSKYAVLHKRMTILHKVLTKMYANSEILLEDTKDQVKVKEVEYRAIKTSHSAMKSAMNIISGDKDKRAMFDQAMEHIADDVANKVGEMEQFMEMSSSFMDSIDLQSGVFEEQGLKMLEEYEKRSSLLLMGGSEQHDEVLDLDEMPEVDYNENTLDDSSDSDYKNLFE